MVERVKQILPPKLKPPKGLPRTHWSTYYELVAHLGIRPGDFERLREEKPEHYDALTRFYGLGRPREKSTRIKIGAGVTHQEISLRVQESLRWLGLPTAISRLSPRLAPWIRKYGRPSAGLAPSLLPTNYKIRRIMKERPKLFGRLPLKERETLLKYLGIGAPSRTYQQLADEEGTHLSAIHERVKRALSKFGLRRKTEI